MTRRSGSRTSDSPDGTGTHQDRVPPSLRVGPQENEGRPHAVGSSVALRSIRPVAGHGLAVVFAVAGVVLHDDDDVTVVATAPGSGKASRSGIRGGPRGRNLVDSRWEGTHEVGIWDGEAVVRVHRRGQCWSIWRWHDGTDWGTAWYGNLEAPWRRSSLGYDTQDWALDVVGDGVPGSDDWSVAFKDEDELQWYADQGACTPQQAADIYRVGDELKHDLESGGGATDEDWDLWVPPADLPIVALPDGWDSPRP